jgi:GntR family transcriptional regulator
LSILNRKSPIPLYYQLAEWIKEQIQTGELTPEAQLPSERELSEEFKVSRMTVRQSISFLVNQGVLTVKKGVGTFVAKPKLDHDILHLLSFSEEMTRQGGKVVSRIMEQSLCIPLPSVARELRIQPDTLVFKIVRLRMSGDTPLLLESSFIPAALCPGLEDIELSSTSLYAVLEQEYGLSIKKADQTLEAITANEYESALFGIKQGTAMVLVEGVAYLVREQPVEYFKAVYRGDRFKFRLQSQQDPDSDIVGQSQISMVLA